MKVCDYGCAHGTGIGGWGEDGQTLSFREGRAQGIRYANVDKTKHTAVCPICGGITIFFEETRGHTTDEIMDSAAEKIRSIRDRLPGNRGYAPDYLGGLL